MRTRITFGLLIILFLIAMFWLDYYQHGFFICLVAMVLTGAGLQELFAMARKVDLHPFAVTGTAFGVVLLPYYVWSDVLPNLLGYQAFLAFLVAPLFVLILALMGRACSRPEGFRPQLKNISVTVFGVLYVALPMALLVRTRFLTRDPVDGWLLTILVICVAKSCDIGAFFAGVKLGRHKLAPRVSPNKTIEGAVGGLAASTAVAVLLTYRLNLHTLTDRGPLATIAFGIIVGVAAQIGDLTESLVKRSTDTKDSGAIIPSFGGVLDLIDSLLVAAPVAYFVLSIFAKVAGTLKP